MDVDAAPSEPGLQLLSTVKSLEEAQFRWQMGCYGEVACEAPVKRLRGSPHPLALVRTSPVPTFFWKALSRIAQSFGEAVFLIVLAARRTSSAMAC